MQLKRKKFKDIIQELDLVVFLLIIAVFAFISFGCVLLCHVFKAQVLDAQSLMQKLNQQNAYSIQNRLHSDFHVLDTIASSLGSNPKNVSSSFLKSILSNNSSGFFDELSVINLDSNVIASTSNINVGNAKNPCFNSARAGNRCVLRINEATSKSYFNKNVYAVPIISNEQVIAVLSGSFSSDVFKNILELNNFYPNTINHIITTNGKYIVRDDNSAIKKYDNFFYNHPVYLKTTYEDVFRNISAKNSGYYWSFDNGHMFLTTYTPISFDNWLAVSSISAKTILDHASKLMGLTIMLMLGINILLYFIIKRIIYLQSKNNKEIMKFAFEDDVTGDRNKTKFLLDAKSCLENSLPQDKFAMIFMEITKFELINEIYGFSTANQILKGVMGLLKTLIPEDSIYARYFGATFSILIKYNTEKCLKDLIDKIYKHIEIFNLSSMKAYVKMGYPNASSKLTAKLVPIFGVCAVTDKNISIDTLCDRAGMAQRTIKNNVDQYLAFYNDKMSQKLIDEKAIEDEMYNAIEERQFVMYLQPKYDMKTLKIAGSEALARWIHPTRGFISPAEFIPLFEKNGFVVNLDRYIWEEACKSIRRQINRGIKPTPISVNVSRNHLQSREFVNDLKGLINEYKIPVELIELELTETATYENFDQFLELINELKDFGFSIAMDDFGSGYSSLNCLRLIPVDILKLDRGFINDTTNDQKGKLVVKHVLAMARSLNLKTIAEGIETVEQAKFLTNAGCDIAQGFLYAKPMTEDEFEELAFADEALKIDGLS